MGMSARENWGSAWDCRGGKIAGQIGNEAVGAGRFRFSNAVVPRSRRCSSGFFPVWAPVDPVPFRKRAVVRFAVENSSGFRGRKRG
jgi:hypothetical protein